MGLDSGVLKLYDIRSYDKGPFETFVVRTQPQQPQMNPKIRNDTPFLLTSWTLESQQQNSVLASAGGELPLRGAPAPGSHDFVLCVRSVAMRRDVRKSAQVPRHLTTMCEVGPSVSKPARTRFRALHSNP